MGGQPVAPPAPGCDRPLLTSLAKAGPTELLAGGGQAHVDGLRPRGDGHGQGQVVQGRGRHQGDGHAEHVPHLGCGHRLAGVLALRGLDGAAHHQAPVLGGDGRGVQEVAQVGGVVELARGAVPAQAQEVGLVPEQLRHRGPQGHRLVQVVRVDLAAAQFLAVQGHLPAVVRLQLTGGLHPVRQGDDGPGVLLGGGPAPAPAAAHEPAHHVGQQGILRLEPDEGRQDDAGGPDVRVHGAPVRGLLGPGGAGGGQVSLAGDGIQEAGHPRIRRTVLLGQVGQGHGQVGLSVDPQAIPGVVEGAGPARVPLPHLREDEVDEGHLVELPGLLHLVRGLEVALQEAHALAQHGRRHRIALLVRGPEPPEDVGGDEGIALAVGPPAPAPVRVLEVDQFLQSHPQLEGQLLLQLWVGDAQAVQGPHGHQVGQEAAHCLLRALVGEVGQVVQAFQHACGQAGLQSDLQLAALPGLRGQVDDLQAALRRHGAGGGHHLRRLVADHGELQAHRVPQFPGHRGVGDHHPAGLGIHRDELVEAGLAAGIQAELGGPPGLRRLAGEEGRALHGQGHVHRLQGLGRGVADQSADLGPVPRGEEAGQGRPDEQILGGDDLVAGVPHQGLVADGPDDQPPGGQVVRQGHGEAHLAQLIGDQVRLPVGHVREVAAQLQQASLAAATAALGSFRQLLVEPVLVDDQERARVHAQRHPGVEAVQQGWIVARGQAEHRLVDEGRAQLRARHRIPGLVRHREQVAHHVPGLEAGRLRPLQELAGRVHHLDLDGQLLGAGVHRQLHVADAQGRDGVGLVHPLDQDHAHVDVGDVLLGDGDLQGLAVALQHLDPPLQDAAALQGHQGVDRPAEGAGHQHFGRLAGLVEVLVPDQLHAVVVLSPPGDEGPGIPGLDPDEDPAADGVAGRILPGRGDQVLATLLRRPGEESRAGLVGGEAGGEDRRALHGGGPVVGAVRGLLVDAVPDHLVDHQLQLHVRHRLALGGDRHHVHVQGLVHLTHVLPGAEADVEGAPMHRHAGPSADKLVRGALDRHVEGPALAAQGLPQVRRELEDEGPIRPGDARPLLEQAAVVAAEGVEAHVLLQHRVKAEVAALGRVLPLEEVGLGQEGPGERRIGQGFAAEVAGLHGDADGVALDVLGLVRGHLDLELGLAVLGHLEAGPAVDLPARLQAQASLQAVVAGDRFRGQGQLAEDGAVLVQGQLLVEEHRASPVPDEDLHGEPGRGQLVVVVLDEAHDALPVDRLAGAVDGPIRVEGQAGPVHVRAEGHVELPGAHPLVPGGGGHAEMLVPGLPADGHQVQPGVFRIQGQGGGGHPRLIGDGLAQGLPFQEEAHLLAGHRLAGLQAGLPGQALAHEGLLHHQVVVAQDQDRLGRLEGRLLGRAGRGWRAAGLQEVEAGR